MKGGFIDTPKGVELRRQSGGENVATMRAFVNYIMNNSQPIRILSSSSLYGMVYQATLNPGVRSPVALHDFTSCKCQLSYPNAQNETCDVDTFPDLEFAPTSPLCLTDVTTFILKLAFIGPVPDAYFEYEGRTKGTETRNNFAKESRQQYEIYNKEFNAGLSIVPPVLSSEPLVFNYSDPQIQEYKNFFITKLPKFQDIMVAAETASFGGGILSPADGFAFIPMLFADGYETLADIRLCPSYSDATKHNAIILGCWALWRLGIKYHKTHGDEHSGNVMINVKQTGEFLNTDNPHKFTTGKVLIIDLGRTETIPDEVYATIMRGPNTFYNLMNYEIKKIQDTYGGRPLLQYHWPLTPPGYTGALIPKNRHNARFEEIKAMESRYQNTLTHLNSKLANAKPGIDFQTISVEDYNQRVNALPPYGTPPPDNAVQGGRRNTRKRGRKVKKKTHKRTFFK